MKYIKWLATLLSAAAILFLLFNVFMGRKMEWSPGLRDRLTDISYIVLGISFLLFIFYYWAEKNSRMMIRWLVLLFVAVAAWLICGA